MRVTPGVLQRAQFEQVVSSKAMPVKSALVLSVSKRLAPAAPLRNMIRRVLRESWRHQALADRSEALAVMIRLRSLPLMLNEVPTGSSVSIEKTPNPVKPPKGRAVLRIRRPDRALKSIIRAEADSLLLNLSRSMSRTPANG